MQDYEKLGVFYLGRRYDLATKQRTDDPILYDSRDLVTHAVCVGMTGSGKTGLCISLLEEAAIDGVPAIVIDPKGDLANLMLTFPELRGADFLPWVNEEEARRKGVEPAAYAEAQAALWKKGLAEWGQDGGRIGRLRGAAEFAIYTPGSSAGIPLSILKSFQAPEKAVLEDGDLLRERVATTATSLLALVGIDADPVKSREHILLSTILDGAWRQGRDLDLAGVIQQIQDPPVQRVGVFDLESFFPSKERFGLAMTLNNLLASPGFSTWLEGEALDVGRLLWTPAGKPRVAIVSIAHLSDAERMFFVSLLLTQVLGWMRTQSGTTSLRALLYMDEIFGFFPPVANPPSKQPLLTLLKQARAYGLGVVLATQNPVDLDYKGLGNTGTWLLGRLQTERDKQRVLEGLEGASGGARFDRDAMERTLAGLGNRVFLMHNVHEDAPVVFESRWAMSYLRGPLTRVQIKLLMAGLPGQGSPATGAAPAVGAGAPAPAARPATRAEVAANARPMLPPDVPQFFVRPRADGDDLVYEPKILAVGRIYYADAKAGVAADEEVAVLADPAARVDWDGAAATAVRDADLERVPAGEDAFFGLVPPEAAKGRSYLEWGKAYAEWLYRTRRLDLFKSPATGAVSKPGESERDFRIRLQTATREKRDAVVGKVRGTYAPRIARLEERIRTAEAGLERERSQSTQQSLQTAVSIGATILGAFLGRKTVSASSIGRATTAVRGAGRTMKEREDVGRATANVQELAAQRDELQRTMEDEIARVQAAVDPLAEQFERVTIAPKKKDIAVSVTALAWVPYRRDGRGGVAPA
jgi:outer membrane murein-binding lipoprotein Lpp